MHASAPPTCRLEYESPVALLRADRDLAHKLSDSVLRKLEPRLLAHVVRLTAGRWEAPWLPASDGDAVAGWPLGLLVLDGMLLREVRVRTDTASRAERAVGVELLGPGDLLRPWQDDEGELLRCSSSWQIFQPARLALLDRRIARATGSWPELMDELLERSLRRSRWLTVTIAVNSAGTARERLVLTSEHLADRWGRMTPEGIVIPLPLNHRMLAELTGMTRPTCSGALSWLARHELLSRRREGTWWLRPDAREQLTRLLAAEDRSN